MQCVMTGQNILFSVAVLSLIATRSFSDDTVDDSATRWKVERSDCQAIVKFHAIEASNETLSGTAEHIQIRGGAGTFCYAARATEKSHVIADYDARIRIRSDRTGITAHARIVFPHAIDKRTNEAVSVLVLCDKYDAPGSWQELRINGLAKRLNEHIRYVRGLNGRAVDVSGAYIDGHVLNIFGGPGTTNVLVGESHTTGNVSLGSVRAGPDYDRRTQQISPVAKRPRATIDGGLLRLGEELFVPSVLEYRGEPLAMVAKLGFNTVVLSHLPSARFMADVEQNNLWVMCPPPLRSLMGSTQSLDRVIFWNMGKVIGRPTLEYSKAIEQLRMDDPRQRLLVCGAGSEESMDTGSLRHVARFADVIVADFGVQNASGDSIVNRFDRLHQRDRATGSQSLTWAKVDSNDSLFRQSGVEVLQAAIAAGANGIWFQSNGPLNENDAKTQLRRTTIAAANLKLQSIRPWAVGVGQRRVVSRTAQPRTRVVQIVANDAALLLIVRDNSLDSQPIVITSPTTTESSDAFQLLPTGLRPLKTRRVSGGLAITVDEVDPTSPLVVTENRIATNQLARFASATRHRSIAIQHALAEASLRLAESTTDGSGDSSRTARQFYDRGRDLLKSGDSTNAYHAFQNVRRELYRR